MFGTRRTSVLRSFFVCFVSFSCVSSPAVASLIMFSPQLNEQRHRNNKEVEVKPRDGRVCACGGVVSMSLCMCNWVSSSNGEKRVRQQAEGRKGGWVVSAHLSVHHLLVVATFPSVFAAPHLSFSLILRHCLFIGTRVRHRISPSSALAFSRGLLDRLLSLSLSLTPCLAHGLFFWPAFLSVVVVSTLVPGPPHPTPLTRCCTCRSLEVTVWRRGKGGDVVWVLWTTELMPRRGV